SPADPRANLSQAPPRCERRCGRQAPPLLQLMESASRRLGALPPPLWGRVGEGGGCCSTTRVSGLARFRQNQNARAVAGGDSGGEGERTECAALFSRQTKRGARAKTSPRGCRVASPPRETRSCRRA